MHEAAQKIELLLFYEGGTLTKKVLRDALACDEGQLVQALLLCKDSLKGRGVDMYDSATDVSLRAAPHLSQFLADYEKKTLSENLGSAAIEVLAVLMYRGPSTQADIDSIRGVNSAFSLRTLRMRGLITRDDIDEGGAVVRNMYSLTTDALAHLGVSSAGDIPDRESIRAKLVAFEGRAQQEK